MYCRVTADLHRPRHVPPHFRVPLAVLTSVCPGTAGPARGFVPACGGGLQGAQRTGNPLGACGAGKPQGVCGGELCRPKGLGSCISPGLCRTYARAASGLV